jgi:adenine phosphoribosyltransferase
MNIDDALLLIREIPDYPKPGIRFQDITPLLAHGEAFIATTEKFASFADERAEKN